MRLVTVSRKPCSEASTTANAAVHGCGALNIDGTRIAGAAWTRSTETIEDIRGGRYGTASKDRVVTGPREMPTGGRWPANLLLQHRGCARVGVARVPGHKGYPNGPGGKSDPKHGWGARRSAEVRPHAWAGHADAEGMETVAVYDCARGCPVAELDVQSGTSVSSGGRLANISKGQRIYGGGKGLGVDLPAEAVRGDPGYGDVGGASRYFKQVST